MTDIRSIQIFTKLPIKSTRLAPSVQTLIIMACLIITVIPSSSFAQNDPASTETTPESVQEIQGEMAQKQTIKRQTLAEIQANRKALLASEYPSEAIKHIGAGDASFIGLYEKDKTGNPYGAVLIVHGEGQTADFPHTISAIRHELPQHGWTSLSITLPEQAKPAVPPRPITIITTTEKEKTDPPINEQDNNQADQAQTQTPDKNMDSNNNDAETPERVEKEKLELKTPEDVEAIALARITAAISFLNDEGQFNIVIAAHGTSALRVMSYLAEASATPPSAMNKNVNKNTKIKIQRPIRAMVFLNARNHILGIDNPLTHFLNMADLPVLDIYFDEHHLDDLEAAARKKAAKNHNMTAYFSVKLLAPSNTIFEDENRFTRRVKGFLLQHARGVEIESKR